MVGFGFFFFFFFFLEFKNLLTDLHFTIVNVFLIIFHFFQQIYFLPRT